MRRYIFVILLFFVGFNVIGSSIKADLIKKLDDAFSSKEKFVEIRRAKISIIRKRLDANHGASEQTRFNICNQLYHQYKSFIFDSAFYYCEQMINLSQSMNDEAMVGYSKTNLGFTLLSAGMFKEAFDTLSTVNVKTLLDTTKVEYYALMARTYYDLCDYNQDNYYCPLYVKNGNTYVDFGTSLAEPDSYHYLYLNGLKNLRLERTDEAIGFLDKLLEKHPNLSGQRYAITVSTLSYLHLKLGDTTRSMELLVYAAISDIEHAIKETSALTNLAVRMYDAGELEIAYKYIHESMSDAKKYGAIQRMSQVGNILPIISSAKLNNVEGQRHKLLILSSGLTILAMLTISFAVLMVIQKGRISKRDMIIKQNNERLKGANTLLSELNKIKDEYLGFYFDLNSKYLDKMANIKSTIETKLLEHKYDDIRYILRKADLKKERENLFTNFDKSFVKIFPNYIEDFNALFEESHRIYPGKEEILNTELRLFALIRIGIHDSDRLASILGYSVNTIYAYKNRIKNQSFVSNNEFEQKILEIQSK